MASSNADWVRGVARLISSASNTLLNTGPGMKWNLCSSLLYTLMPVMSDGIKSGVHCKRFIRSCSDCANARASVVLPSPGASSSNKCPRHSKVTSSSFRLRSEEHTSELQSRENLVCRLLLEKKKRG